MNSSERLTHDGRRKLAPVFTAGGREVVFAAHDTPNLVALTHLKLADGSRERLHPALAAHQFDPCFSAEGRYHAFVLSATSPQLVLVIQDTKERTEATYRPRDARATARGPSISPDASRVVFSVSDVGGQQITSVNLRGQDFRKLTDSAGVNCWPSFSPDGQRVAFASSREGHFQIYVMAADGTGVRRLTREPGMCLRPAWSPDGKRIAFTGNRDGRYAVYVMNADGSPPRRLATDSERDDYPAWHPDGKRILTISERAGRCDLYLLDAPS